MLREAILTLSAQQEGLSMDGREAGRFLSGFSTCDIADALDALGYRDQSANGIRRIWDGCPTVAGRVLPVLLGAEEEGSTVIGTLEAIKAAKPGDVLLFDNGGRLDINTFGSIAAFCAARMGMAGAVIDGATRDVDDMQSQAFPVYAKGVLPMSVRGRTGMAGFNVPVQCSGVQVQPGDYLVADGSGVIFVPQDLLEDVIRIVPHFPALERELKTRIIEGADFVDIHNELQYEEFEAQARDK